MFLNVILYVSRWSVFFIYACRYSMRICSLICYIYIFNFSKFWAIISSNTLLTLFFGGDFNFMNVDISNSFLLFLYFFLSFLTFLYSPLIPGMSFILIFQIPNSYFSTIQLYIKSIKYIFKSVYFHILIYN